MADAADSKSADRKVVKVRLLSPAPSNVPIRQTVSFSERPTTRERMLSATCDAPVDTKSYNVVYPTVWYS